MEGDVTLAEGTGPGSRRLSGTRAGWVAVLVVTATSMALRVNSPMFLRPQMSHDEALFTRLAGNVLDGSWLGPYDKLTLAKGPAYPLFVAAVYEIGVPLKLAEQALHLVAGALIALAVWRVARSRLLALVAYAVVALDPAYLGRRASTTTREGFYGSLSLLLVAGLILFLTWVPALVRRGPRWSVPAVGVVGAAFGLVAATYYLCRDERLWILPALLVATLAGVACWRGADRPTVPHGVVAVGMAAFAALTFVVSVGWVTDRNQAAYGTSVASDLAEGEIARAYTQWQRVDVGDERTYVPVSRAQRAAVYAISPAAAELEATLEGPATAWITLGCSSTGVCSDFTGAFFVWALRDAGEASGHAGSGAEAQRFFGQIADDIEAACNEVFRCRSPGIGPMPPVSRIDAGAVARSFWATTETVLSYDVANPTRGRSGGTGADDGWAVMTRSLRGIDHDQSDYVAAEASRLDDQHAVSALMVLYRWGIRIGAVFALVGLVAGAASRAGRQRPALLLTMAALLIAVLSRVGFVALIDATSYPAAHNSGYLLPCLGFLVVFVVVGVWMLVDAARHAVEAREAPTDGLDLPPAEPVETASSVPPVAVTR